MKKFFSPLSISMLLVILLLVLVSGCGRDSANQYGSPPPSGSPPPTTEAAPDKPAPQSSSLYSEKLDESPPLTPKSAPGESAALKWSSKLETMEKKLKASEKPAEPVYNLEVTPKKLGEPLVLLPGKITHLTFYIGPKSSESVITDLPSAETITAYQGDKLPLTVTLTCSVCEENTIQTDQIAYRPKDRESSKARFTIMPSAAAVSKSHGIGDLLFTVDDRGKIVDMVRVKAFVGDPTPEGRAAYVKPAKVPFETIPADKGKPPDIVIIVGSDAAGGRLPIVIRPGRASLLQDFRKEFGRGDGSKPKIDWEFKSGVTKAELDGPPNGLVFDIYKAFRTLNEQNKMWLQDVYKSLGSNVTLSRGAASLNFQDKDLKNMLDLLKKEGRRLYWRLFLEGADPDLKKAMVFIENLPSDPPVRVAIWPVNVYVPWQILYSFKEGSEKNGETDPNKFWGFRYVLGITHLQDSAPGRPHSLIPSPQSREIAFAGWRRVPADDVTERVGKLGEHLKSKTGAAVEPFYERQKFLDKLANERRDIRFVFAYGHATSGTVLATNQPIISGVEWATPHFKFSDKEFLTYKDFDDLKLTLALTQKLPQDVYFPAQPIVILDACETGTFGINPMNNNSFVGALTRLGAGAVIVTESPVLANFAYHFGMNLMDEIFDGEVDVSQAMLNVRLKHLKEWKNPLGLVYTLYGNPAAQIKRR